MLKYVLTSALFFCVYSQSVPQQWGETVTGVKTKLVTSEKVIALTLDLCGGATDGCDYRYINFFEKENIPVTLFVTKKWILKHPDDFAYLCSKTLFDIQNHGLLHRPCSINGNSVYNIQGTKNASEIKEEVDDNAQFIAQYIGRKPRLYRSGTAYYDELAVAMVNKLGYEVIGFSVLGDKGGTASQTETEKAVSQAQAGDIVILHMNRPEKLCALGAIAAIKDLRNQGFSFVKVSDCELQ